MRILLALCCCAALGTQAEVFDASVIAVVDGDTLLVLQDGHKIKVRLDHIDAPEKAQPFGKQSRNSLRELVGGKRVIIDCRASDQYGRLIGLVVADGRNINLEQVRRGMAWADAFRRKHHPQQAPHTSDSVEQTQPSFSDPYLMIQDEARQSLRGLWAQTDPLPPWRWRKLHPWDKRGTQ